LANSFKYTNKGNSVALITDGSGYKNFLSKNWTGDMALFQLEAYCQFYKLTCGIDAFPFLLDHSLMKTPQDFVDII